MVKPLRFKGDPKPKKRKRAVAQDDSALPTNSKSTSTSATAAAGTAEAAPEDDDAWVSADTVPDVTGPIMIVLPTTPPCALACDGAGKVYRAKIENIVDGIVASAEPHDVQMVWVANKVAGSEDAVRLKSHHGRLLSIDKNGLLSATSEVMSTFESFSIVDPPHLQPSGPSGSSGKFLIRSAAGQYIKVSKSNIVGDADVGGEEELNEASVSIRMQARFKPELQAVKAEKAREKVSRKDLEAAVGRRLEDNEVRTLKRARRDGDYHEKLLDLKVKGKHDKYG
ncbi:FRG1-like family protein [Zalerion maritima]|uniref:FRG1-like family protein n=1 Tax=Zalerion maritima TaxID=339359 RepID=A0AAD5WWV9_9PEZI|nr:FRG1-like family protein [Zalerion maritima]